MFPLVEGCPAAPGGHSFGHQYASQSGSFQSKPALLVDLSLVDAFDQEPDWKRYLGDSNGEGDENRCCLIARQEQQGKAVDQVPDTGDDEQDEGVARGLYAKYVGT